MTNANKLIDFSIDGEPSPLSSYRNTRPSAPSSCETKETFASTKTLPPERDALLRSIAYLRKLEDDFDGAGTLVPEKEVLDTAERFILTCFGHMYPTAVYPGMDRTLEFVYEGGTAEIPIHMVVDVDHLHVSRINGSRLEMVGAFFLPLHGVALPKEIKAVLPPYRILHGGNSSS